MRRECSLYVPHDELLYDSMYDDSFPTFYITQYDTRPQEEECVLLCLYNSNIIISILLLYVHICKNRIYL